VALEDEMSPWMQRCSAADVARSVHAACAARIRRKLADNTTGQTLLDEAFEMVRRDIGPFPSEENPSNEPFPDEDEDPTERDMQQIARSNFEFLSETKSYMWELGIVGVFHQWERDTRFVIAALSTTPPKPEKLANADFEELCAEVEKTGFVITADVSFAVLPLACLKANTIKHGSGRSFEKLVEERRDLFHGGPVGVRMGNLPPQPQHLRLSVVQFDEIVAAIDNLWLSYEGVALRVKG
jgi:hypothetical protein